ncbi:DEAD/DEAH box helicase [Bifidobacterium apri]|uniref:DEAD/DEAH box helicase n=1 Tax=Bifidobacterium apri TaxID=1769423 RepID=UPI0039955525
MSRHSHHAARRRESDTGRSGKGMEDSPSARYQRFRQGQQYRKSAVARFASSLPFDLDSFQIQACEALESGDNVLVAAPTGAGKTVVADFAMYLAHEHHVKAFYTTPIKALSNQKYHDLSAIYGPDRVGLLTGDTSINAEADIVVMTTEVLRNMLYEHSNTVLALQYVILDEVHYLADRFRGPVWEEVIIHLPKSVRIVGLSATVSNVEDFSAWISSVRGSTQLVVSEHRPVPLEQHVMVQANEHTEPELIDLYRRDGDGEATTRLNPQLSRRIDQLDHQAARKRPSRGRHHGRHTGAGAGRSPYDVERFTPRRAAVIDELNYLGMLPGIYFIFSRNGCDQAVEQCINAGLELTTDDEAMRIREIVDEMVEGQMSRDDLKALRFSRFRFALEEGFASHHAGMIALFRQIVERLFEEGLVKVVFATETLALGINMPARSVIVEKLEKYDGTGHVMLTPGEFTQLTGRAGRRGIDTIGHAVIVDHKGFIPATAAALSSKRVYPLHSSFKPTFNMAVNLLYSSSYETARKTLDQSFAQWEANESAWQLESQMHTLEHALEGYEQAAYCDRGDFTQFMLLRMKLGDLQKNGRRELKHRSFISQEARSHAFRDLDRQIAEVKWEQQHHSCAACPDLQEHLRWGHRWMRERRELDRVQRRYDSRTGSVARQFDHICDILVELGYLERHQSDQGTDIDLTAGGRLLRQLYSEQDLVLAQAIRTGLLDTLTPQQLAAALSGLVYESRRTEGGEPRRYPGGSTGPVAHVCSQLRAMSMRINALREDYGLERLPDVDFGIVDVVYAWAEGEPLAVILHDVDLTGGDFVRNMKRLADMLQQIASALPGVPEYEGPLSTRAHAAQLMINRGVVAYSGVD